MTAEHDVPNSITALSTLSGVPEEEVAIQVACVFTAIAGPHAALNTYADEFQPVGFHLLHLGGDSPRQHRLADLLFQPLRFIQDDLLEFSRLASPEHLDWMSEALFEGVRDSEVLWSDPNEEKQEKIARRDTYHLADLSSQGFSRTDPWRRRQDVGLYIGEYGHEPHLRVDGIHHYSPTRPKLSESYIGRHEERCLREPVLFLDNPGPKVLEHSWDNVDRRSPLILDETGRLWDDSLSSASDRKIVKKALSDRTSFHPAAHTKDQIRNRCPHFFSIVTQCLGEGVISDPKLENLLARCVLTKASPPRGGKRNAACPERIGSGYFGYRGHLQNLVSYRRQDSQDLWSTLMPDKVALEFLERQRAFTEQLESVDSSHPAFLAAFSRLPASLLWTIMRLGSKKEVTSEQVATALYFAESAVRNHLNVLHELRSKSESERIQRKAAEMLRKLLEAEPCSLRDLLRKYTVQRRDVHEPVLAHLIETGKVLKLESNQYRLTEEARAELTMPVTGARNCA
ncbi:MAG: hypothetical protein MI807_19100 [Verrucomicrobiales bacterium]|nr:hypothetical protein [Verrucomicrobiales bacterium]